MDAPARSLDVQYQLHLFNAACCTLVTRQEDVVTGNLPILTLGRELAREWCCFGLSQSQNLYRYQGLESHCKDDEYERDYKHRFDNS